MLKHGGDIYSLSEEQRSKVIDYSSNVSPININSSIKKAVMKNFDSINRYPDINYLELRKSIGIFNNIDTNFIIPGNGATEILFLYCKSENFKRATIVVPTFSEYERALRCNDVKVDYFYLKESTLFDLDIEKFILDGIYDDTDLVVLCNPNNPTGKFIPLEKIKLLNDILKSKGVKLFIDECFIDFISDWREKSSAILKDENIFILRAFTKYFAVPGLRLGYGICFDKGKKEKILQYKEPWSINSFAETIGRTVVDNKEYIRKTDNWIKKEKRFFYNKLIKIKQILPFLSETNFILIKLLTMDSKQFKEKMLLHNILIRDASNFNGLDKSYVRLAIKSRKDNIKVIDAIMEVMKCQEF